VNPQPIDPHWAELSTLVARAEQNRAAMAKLHAERAELCAEALVLVENRVAQRHVAQRRDARAGRAEPIGDAIPLREVIAELGAALRVSDQTVQRWLGDGAALVSTYPATLDALRQGRIDERHASAIIDGGTPIVDGEVRAEYESTVLTLAEHETAPSLRRHAEVIAGRLQPDVVDERHRAAHERRRLRIFDLEPGVTRLLADIPTVAGHAAYDRLTEMAIALDCANDADGRDDSDDDDDDDDDDGTERDDRTMDQRRADLFCDLLLCGAPAGHGVGDALAAIRGTVQVTIPVLTLAGIGDEPAVLAGHGPIDADTARCLAAGAPGWDRIMFHPHTGEPLAVDRYRPSSQLRRFLAARDEHCRWLGCRRKAEKCDADHTVAHAEGGKTTSCNLCLFCRKHHVLKHASPWQVRQLGRGRLEFTSPTGRVYRNDAPAVVQFVSRPEIWEIPPDPNDPPPF